MTAWTMVSGDVVLSHYLIRTRICGPKATSLLQWRRSFCYDDTNNASKREFFKKCAAVLEGHSAAGECKTARVVVAPTAKSREISPASLNVRFSTSTSNSNTTSPSTWANDELSTWPHCPRSLSGKVAYACSSKELPTTTRRRKHSANCGHRRHQFFRCSLVRAEQSICHA